MDRSSLVLLPECEVRGLLRDSDVSLRMLRPPYPALGVGTLRVLRLRTADGTIEIVAGYERYERIPDADSSCPSRSGRHRSAEESQSILTASPGGS